MYGRFKGNSSNLRSRISNVTVQKVKPDNLEWFRREMECVEMILENLIYKVLSKRLAKDQR